MRFDWCGGRKQFNGYLFCLMTTIMAFPLGAGFGQYAGALAMALLGTSAMVAWEDTKKGRG